ncbi:MAG: TlpA disulfide reductase family protein [Bacteroidota bacterium]|nr:TlpA disulfide reductase family protein [Bacteroidota bacterium]
MSTRIKILLSLLFAICFAHSQQVSAVYKIVDLLKRVDQSNDTVYVLNFWATWCVPCVKELPEIDSFAIRHKNENVKVIMVSLDFKDELENKVNPFLKKNNYKTECVLLDEINGNDFIDKIDKRWTGSIPATYFIVNKRRKTAFIEKKIGKTELEAMLLDVK